MSAIPSNLARVPNLLSSQILLGSLNKTNQDLLQLQIQLASGKAVNRPSDDAPAASAIAVLDDSIERRDQRVRNLTHGEAVLNNVDAALSDATSLLQEARQIGLSQIGVGSDATTRESQAVVIDSILQQLTSVGNRKYQDIYFFGGNQTAIEPLQGLGEGIRYVGQGDGLVTDTGLSRAVPITINAADAFGSLSARVEGNRDLDPAVSLTTRVADLNGANGDGVSLGAVAIDINGTDITVDLTNAHSVQDVIDTLQTEIQTVDPGATVTLDGATSGIRVTPSGGTTITIDNTSGLSTASDLGITGVFTGPGGAVGGDLDARITEQTLLSGLSGVTTPLGTIRIQSGSAVRDVDLSSAQTVQDLVNLVEGLNLGVRVDISEDGTRLNFLNEVSGADLSIGEFGGGTTATELGVRSLTTTTRLEDFNDGLGVEILDGNVDPVTGAPDPPRDVDFRVELKDGRGFDVDLAGAETVQDVLDAINNAATTSGVGVPAEFEARLTDNGNGIDLVDNTAGVTTSVTAVNGSHAAYDLGILGSSDSAILSGEDRATVAVDSAFTRLIRLRDALTANDERGIELATQRLESDIDRAARSRALVGVRTRQITEAQTREEDLRLQEISLRSDVQDLDFTEAAVRFAQLQQQLQAGLSSAAQAQSLTLLDFLR